MINHTKQDGVAKINYVLELPFVIYGYMTLYVNLIKFNSVQRRYYHLF